MWPARSCPGSTAISDRSSARRQIEKDGDTLRTVGGAPDDPSGEDDMHWSRASALSAPSFLLALFLGAPPPPAGAQASPEPARVHKSVRGTLQSVDNRQSSVIMKSDA